MLPRDSKSHVRRPVLDKCVWTIRSPSEMRSKALKILKLCIHTVSIIHMSHLLISFRYVFIVLRHRRSSVLLFLVLRVRSPHHEHALGRASWKEWLAVHLYVPTVHVSLTVCSACKSSKLCAPGSLSAKTLWRTGHSCCIKFRSKSSSVIGVNGSMLMPCTYSILSPNLTHGTSGQSYGPIAVGDELSAQGVHRQIDGSDELMTGTPTTERSGPVGRLIGLKPCLTRTFVRARKYFTFYPPSLNTCRTGDSDSSAAVGPHHVSCTASRDATIPTIR